MRILTQVVLSGIFTGGWLWAAAPTSIQLNGPQTASFGAQVTLTGNVTLQSGGNVTGGKVTFFDGTTVLGTTSVSNGNAALNTISLPAGINSVTAFYQANATLGNASSLSSPLGVTVTARPGFGFGPPSSLNAGNNPFAAAVGDVNGDGIPDLVVANANTSSPGGTAGSVTVFLGNGSGGFSAGANFAVDDQPRSVAIADFNGDGKLDIATVNSYTDDVSILLNTSTGPSALSFALAANYGVSSTHGAYAIAIADFNGDGIPDIAATSYSDGYVNVFLGVGDGTFGASTAYPVGSVPDAIAIGDFNGDGFADIVTANAGDGGVAVLLGNGLGGFAAAAPFSTGSGTQPTAVTVADFNGDGLADIAVTDSANSNVFVLLNSTVSGTLNFVAAVGYPLNQGSPAGIVTGDFNGDGITDLATANSGGNTVSILLGSNGGNGVGNGIFNLLNSYPVGTGTGPDAIAVGDFNGDGIADLVTANSGFNTASVLLGASQLTLTGAQLPAGTVGTPYTDTITPLGGIPPYSNWSNTGTLPAGLSFANGVITGTPSGGSFASPYDVPSWGTSASLGNSSGSPACVFNVSVTDASTQAASAAFNIPTTPSSSCALFSYAADNVGYSGSWTFQNTAAASGTITFNWQYSGYHAYFEAQAELQAFSGGNASDLFPNSPVSGGFNVSGIGSLAITQGVPFGFTAIGSNFDQDDQLDGNLLITNFSFQPSPPSSTTTTLSSSLNPSHFGQSVTFTATVSPTPSGTGAETVQFYDNGIPLGTAVTMSGSVATYTTSALAQGSHPITATYSGDSADLTSTSSPLTQPVNPALPTITGVNPASGLPAGGGTITITGTGFANATSVTIGGIAAAITANTGTSITVTTPSQPSLGGNGALALSAANTGALAGLYTFDNSSNLGIDSSGNNNNLSVFGSGVTYTSSGRNGGGLALAGTGYLSTNNGNVPPGFPIGNTPYTFSADFEVTGSGNYGFAGWGSNGAQNQVNDFRTNANSPLQLDNYWWSNDLVVFPTVTINDGNFHNFTVMFDGTTRSMYCDGILIGQDTPGSGHNVQNSSFAIGVTTNGEYFTGTLDNVAVWNQAFGPLVDVSVTTQQGTGTLPLGYTYLPSPVLITTSTTLSANPTSVNSGQTFTLTALVTPSSGTNQPTGTVQFFNGTNAFGPPASLVNGQATVTTSFSNGGSYSFSATYNGDSNSAASTSSPVSVTVATPPPALPPVSITPSSLPAGIVGTSYSAGLSASGGTGTGYQWSLNGPLPAGLSFSAGSFSGTPQAAFNGTIGVIVTDSGGNQGNAFLSLQITSAPLSISGNGNLGDIAVGSATAASFTANGGAAGAHTWSISGISGLSVDSSGNVRGTVTPAGTYSGTITVTDSSGASASTALSLAVLGLSGTFPDGTTTTAYSGSGSGVGGVAPYHYTASGIPQGLSFAGGTLSGTESTAGTYTIGVTVTDANNVSVAGTFTFKITGPGPKTLTITTTALPDGFVGQPYSQTLGAAGGNPGYTWAQSGGYMAPGLSLSSSGTISGTPSSTSGGSYTVGVQVTDNSGAKVVGTASFSIDPAPLQITNGSSFPAGQVTVGYPAQILISNGGVAPYTFSVSKGSLPPGLSLSDAQISGTPSTTGSYGFTVTVTDSSTPVQTASVGVALQVNPNQPDLVLSQASDSFTITAGTSAAPSADTFAVASTVSGDIIAYSVSSSVPWLTTGGSTGTPGYITVGPNSAALALSTSGSPYSGTVTVTCTSQVCSGKKQAITVTLNVTSPPPQISLGTPLIAFSAVVANPASQSQSLAIVNAGGGTLTINSVTVPDSWISVGSFPSTVAPGPGGSVTLTANPAGLNPGFYSSSVTVNSSAGTASVPVTLLIAAAGSMTLGPAGTQFSMSQGGALGNPSGSFLVSVSSGSLNYTASVLSGNAPVTLSGGGSGTATPSSPGPVNISINQTAASGLPQGAYYSTVRVSGTGVINSPQDYQVVLNVGPPTSAVVPNPSPAGLVFLTPQGPTEPTPQAITLYASSLNKVSFQTAVTLNSGSGWLSASSSTGTTSAASPAQITVTANPAGLTPGVYTGQIDIAFGSVVSSVNVTLVVESLTAADGTLLSSAATVPETTATCSGGTLVPTQTGLVSNFSAPASWPTPLAIVLADTCGNLVGSGQVVTTFSNGDPPLILSPIDPKHGLYEGTWTPRKTSQQVTILARAASPGYPAATTQIGGQVAPNTAPVLAPNGTLDIFNPVVGSGLGPGNIVQIYGSGLASQIASPSTLPLPTILNGTTVLIGGAAAPLFYVSSGQINAQIPFSLTGGNQYQVIVSANGALTTPQPINLTPAVPAILLYNSGIVVAQHQDGTDVTATSPAAPGEVISFYLSGLGATDQDVPSGSPSPSNPPANVLTQPTMTFNNASAQILFAGLAPGFVGLYQINFQVPSPLTDGNYTLFITQANVDSNSGVIPVQNPPQN